MSMKLTAHTQWCDSSNLALKFSLQFVRVIIKIVSGVKTQ